MNLRNSNKLNVTKSNNTFGEKRLAVRAAKAWNKLEETMQNTVPIQKYKQEIFSLLQDKQNNQTES